ncbi:MAG: chromate transporter [Oscillospiraceae bacterium]|nr:chromate transporter [Oscillospiraceae bacterium]
MIKSLLSLFFAFFRIGLFTFGGGFSMLPMLEREVVDKHKWTDKEELLEYFALGQCVPGVIAVNTATLVGYKTRGILGSLFSALGLITPSIIVITSIAAVLVNFMHFPVVVHAFTGIKAAVGALMASAVVGLIRGNVLKKNKNKTSVKKILIANIPPVLLCAAAFVLVVFAGVSSVYITVGAAVTGIFLFRAKTRDEAEDNV